jgi:hypothetical protein
MKLDINIMLFNDLQALYFLIPYFNNAGNNIEILRISEVGATISSLKAGFKF